MNNNILKYVVAVSEEKNFTRAAKKLYITQPSLSQAIKGEENRLGITLFNRNASPLTVTDAGKEYVLWARQVLELYENMEGRLQDFSSSSVATLKIGILPEFSSFILSQPLKAFRKLYPNSFVKIFEQSNSDLEKNLENSTLDFIIGLTHKDTYKYINEPLYDEKIVLALSPDLFPYDLNAEEVDLIEFKDSPFIMMEEGQFLHNVTHYLCKKSGFVPKAVIECYNLETAMCMVKDGIGISIFPDLMCKAVGNLKYLNIKGQTPESQISLVYRGDRYLIKEARVLIELIKEVTC